MGLLDREYDRVHWVARKLIAAACTFCGSSPVEAALCPSAPKANLRTDGRTGSPYSIDPEDYFALCRPCHRRLDHVPRRTHCKNGHEFTPENTSIRAGARRCRACHRAEERHRLADPAKLAAKNAAARRRPPLTPEQRARKTELQRIRRAP